MEELERIQFPLRMELTSDLTYRKYMRSFSTRIGPTLLKSKVINRRGKWIIVTKIVVPLNLWSASAQLIAIPIATYFLLNSRWLIRFLVSSLVMGHAYLGFLSGIFCYYPEERHTSSPLTTIYRVFKAAFRKRRLPYPSSAEAYYYSSSDGNIEASSNDSEYPLYTRENGSSNGSNEGPSNDLEDPFDQRENDQEVRDAKNLFFIIPLGLSFFAYSLVSASGNTYFVKQTSNLDSKFGSFDVPVIIFFVLQHLAANVVGRIPSRKKVVGPILSIAVGLFCSVLCCIFAGVVVRYRLPKAIGKDPDMDVVPLSIMVVTPQFVLLGLMEGFAEGGLEAFVQDRVPISMRNFVERGIEMLLGIGKFSSILFALIFHWWIKDSINNSHLDLYFLMLASLSFVFIGIYLCCAKFESSKLPKFEGPDTKEEEQGMLGG
ncbi:protein NRT1/ PTR FAMILY 8.3-like [Neltuma alba]|uniref:protein NRT1/ PTR FAMILY 8.3-like n=1 Tax=Neltuma alba TaxID=207710 RepID=UPI0010A399B7|nr:protein NRT1/ PTR FAMILY 8.3-like [Prosopis alba]